MKFPRTPASIALLLPLLLLACSSLLAQEAAHLSLLDQAYQARADNHLELALTLFEQHIAQNPNDLQARLDYGYLLANLGRLEDAVAQLNLAQQLAPGDAKISLQLGDWYSKLGQTDSAIAAFSCAAVASDSDIRFSAKSALARLYYETATEQALPLFLELSALRPNDPLLHKELGYLYLRLDQPAEALLEFSEVVRLDPNDHRAKLQRAHLLDRLGHHYHAYAQFAELVDSPDPDIRREARSADAKLSFWPHTPQPTPYFGEIYLDHTFASRFDSQFSSLVLRQGREIRPEPPWDAYLTLKYSRSRQGSSPLFPSVVTDESTLLGAGIRTRPLRGLPGLTAYSELSLVLDCPPGVSGKDLDFRIGAYYYRDWGKVRPSLADDLSSLTRHTADLYVEAGYYDRYGTNWIAFGRYRHGWQLFRAPGTSLNVYAKAVGYLDTQGDYYNNLVETGVGLRYLPKLRGNVELTLEYLGGHYLGNDGRTPLPFDPRYHDLRVAIAGFSYF